MRQSREKEPRQEEHHTEKLEDKKELAKNAERKNLGGRKTSGTVVSR